jgi:hypothetical protein
MNTDVPGIKRGGNPDGTAELVTDHLEAVGSRLLAS